MAMSELVLSARRDVNLVNTMTTPKGNVLLALPIARPALPLITALAALTPPSLLEAVSALNAPIHVRLVMSLALALHASVDSTTLTTNASGLALLDLPPEMESAPACLEL